MLSELHLDDWQNKHDLTFVKYYSETEKADRIDAEYFQPRYDYLVDAIKNNSIYFKFIKEIKQFNSRGLQPDYCIDGRIKVINSQHILEDHLDYNCSGSKESGQMMA